MGPNAEYSTVNCRDSGSTHSHDTAPPAAETVPLTGATTHPKVCPVPVVTQPAATNVIGLAGSCICTLPVENGSTIAYSLPAGSVALPPASTDGNNTDCISFFLFISL
jgi:hypothetical protein